MSSQDGLPLPPPDLDLTDDLGPHVTVAVVTGMVLATIAVILRIASRLSNATPLNWDDWLVMLSLILAYGTAILTMLVASAGVGKHIWDPDVDVGQVYKYLWAYEYCYGSVVTSTKMSIIMLYHRIFGGTGRLHYTLYICAALVLSWWVAIMVVTGVQCRPYHYFWMRYSDPLNASGVCIDDYAFFMGNGSTSVATEFLLLCVPIPTIWRLQMEKVKRIAICGMFALGGFVCIAGAVRVGFLSEMNKGPDVTWNTTQGFIWSTVEPCIGIVCACLPTMRPLIRRLLPGCFGTGDVDENDGNYRRPSNKVFSGASGGSRHSRVRGDRSGGEGGFHWLQGDNSSYTTRDDDAVHLTTTPTYLKTGYPGSHGSSSRGQRMSSEDSIALGSIAVQQETEWNSSRRAANITPALPPC